MNEVFASPTARSTDDLQCCKRLGTAVQAQGMFEMDPWALQRSVCLPETLKRHADVSHYAESGSRYH